VSRPRGGGDVAGFLVEPRTLTYRRLRPPAASPVKGHPHPRRRRGLSRNKAGEGKKGAGFFAAAALNDNRKGE
jgi:hypothetical protein